MSNSTTQETTAAHTSSNEAIDHRFYNYSDLVLECSCGKTQLLEKAKEGAIQINLVNTDNHNELVLACDACPNQMALKLVENNDAELAQDIQEEDSSDEALHGLSGDNEREATIDLQDATVVSETDGDKSEEPQECCGEKGA